ncbi:hypothetical protein [Plastoroseomonas arctica]|uniref:Uncharacterized protein n=1 Tax=Plastoroseomonas arctica TaxID=1509237 RepID=A0AAF1K702_9PROT|nr:hypothetical protein [Plastoroseomonas arctica]MBR0656871.1 hypothetical protein [Plastoroseomonas arctica]
MSLMLVLTCAACATAPGGPNATTSHAASQDTGAGQAGAPAPWTGGRERSRAYNTSNGGG